MLISIFFFVYSFALITCYVVFVLSPCSHIMSVRIKRISYINSQLFPITSPTADYPTQLMVFVWAKMDLLL